MKTTNGGNMTEHMTRPIGLLVGLVLLGTGACSSEPLQDGSRLGIQQAALATDDAALAELWEIYRDLESARQDLEAARQSVQPNSLREEIRLRMEAARMQLERGREHIEAARVARTEQAFFDAAFELNLGHELLEAERLEMAVPPIPRMTEAHVALAALLNLESELEVPTHVVLRAVPLGFPDFVDHIGGTTVIPLESHGTVSGCDVHHYRSEAFRYNLVSAQPFTCPSHIRLRATGVWNGAPIEEWRQSSEPLAFLRQYTSSNGNFVCAYREPDWHFELSSGSDPACFRQATPLLVLLMDFADTDLNQLLPDAEAQWGSLIFGDQQAQGNHYWNEVLAGRFRLEPVVESQGAADNGVVHVSISSPRPSSGSHVIEDQSWVPEALDLASELVDFAAYDANADGILSNSELSVLVVPNLSVANTEGAGAQANIPFGHVIAGAGVELEHIARTNHTYTSIGVNMHELAHHMLDLDHLVAPTDHGLMGLGAYREDPVIGRLHLPNNHWGTRPTHLIGTSRFLAGTVAPTHVSGTQTVSLNSIHTGDYNIVALPVVGGTLFLENRTSEGYDQSIPFCDGHAGGLFMTELLDTSRPLHTVGIAERREADSYDQGELDFCEFYSVAGHNDSFSYGGYTFTNVSEAGPTMQVQIVDDGSEPEIDSYKFEWWVNDPDRGANYRMRHFERPVAGVETVLDFADMPGATGVSTPLVVTLHGYYDTGEIRSVNHEATWTASSDYLNVRLLPLANTTRMLVNVYLDGDESPVSSATIVVNHSSGTYVLRLQNIPDVTG